ncbi:MAG: GIY-YIG nuclease family protein [Bacteroidetes bacterium]|nr:GIY-YIG nuclease family protein [Bacteroidota bacterium]MBK8362709.1 GIY-YIG nuclease family protein [Bacteroidota bacterium]MBK9412582.1 GIY-YIG nuclease family protein [Bacteroidota bacterium]MBP6426904.1 GIY-YIG nuclease family protein [Bacteroidia bacterium]MBP6657767.1 GIY-YIG nuclease family protein [Bacteroidia bacterium]
MKFAIVDIETTGGNSSRNKITEVAIYIHDGEKIIDEFVSLVNPECPIAPFITNLTGISNEMVEDAPKFYQIAKDIVTLTDGAVFVAHNAQFDYGFIREEFKSLGFNYSRDYLCTVKLSRKLLPGYSSYSLGTLCQNLGISITNRHRASGDALATVKLFEMILNKDPEKEVIRNFTKNDYLNLRFPAGFDHKMLDSIPERPGVYYFHNQDGTVIYIGKSTNIRKRVLSHFANKQTKKAIELRNTIRDVSFEETGNELIALLLESEEIKNNQPFFNRSQRRTVFNYGIFSRINSEGYITLYSEKVKNTEDALITAGSFDEAEAILQRIQSRNNLCQKLCSTKEIKHACFGYSVHMCKGACIGKEDADEYNLRAQKALDSIQYSHQNFMIIGSGRNESEKSVTHIESGRYMGFGYFDPQFVTAHPEVLREHIKPRIDNRDVQRIIRHFLNTASPSNILTY